MSEKIVQLNEEVIKGQLKELVRGSVEETLNELLEAEAEKLTQAARYERNKQRQGYRSGHYSRNLTTTSGDVTLKVPKLKGISFETAIIERYRRRESSVEEALIEMYLAGVSVRRVEDITEALWGSKVSPSTISELNKKAYVHMHYNPFAYLHSEKDILKLVTTLIANTKGEGKAGDDFWVKAETLLYCALIGYIHYEAPVEEQNFSTLIEFINAMEVREDDEEFKNPVDLMFDALEAEKPNHFAVRQYKKYKLAAGKTAKSILISCGARLAVFDIAELREVTSYDELELDTLGDRKTALFLIMSDTDDSFNFLISMCYTQLFNLLCEKADDVYGGRLPVHVRCLIDECANIGQIPKLEKLVATIRSREISACLVLQAQSQLKAIYKDNADTIIGNMDTSIFLGGKEPTTLKELEAVLGKETIDTYNTGESRGRETSHSLNYQKLGKSLMSQDELAVMDGGKCILQLRGVRPFLSDKYDITKHPNFKYTADADDKNAFDIEAFLSARLKLKPNEVCDV